MKENSLKQLTAYRNVFAASQEKVAEREYRLQHQAREAQRKIREAEEQAIKEQQEKLKVRSPLFAPPSELFI